MTTSLSTGDPAASRRAELRDFLMTRRAAVSPSDAGLPAGSRRRTPGLRREEVAVLAGVGVSWYQWLEQGRDITVSPQVLDAVGRVLRLNDAELRHLYLLAGLNPPTPAAMVNSPICSELLDLLDAWMPRPAHLVDHYWNMIAANGAARLVFDWGVDDHPNCLATYFTNPTFRDRYPQWEHNARITVARYRYEMSENPGDAGFAAVVDPLLAESPEFAEIWQRQEVMAPGLIAKSLLHPDLGPLEFDSNQLRLPERPDLSVVLHNPRPGTDGLAKIERFLEDQRRRGGLRLVAG